MKQLIIIVAFLLPTVCFSQTVSKALNPTGYSMSYSPGVTLNNSTALTTIYSDSIFANTFTPGRKYEFTIYCSVTTPLTLFPSLSLNVTLGGTTMNLVSSGTLGASLTKRTFKIHVITFANSLTSQYMYAEIMSDNTGMLLGSNYYSKSMSITENLASGKSMKVTAQFSSAVNIATTYLYIDNIYKDNF